MCVKLELLWENDGKGQHAADCCHNMLPSKVTACALDFKNLLEQSSSGLQVVPMSLSPFYCPSHEASIRKGLLYA